MEWLYEPEPTDLGIEPRCCPEKCPTAFCDIRFGGEECQTRSCGFYWG